VNPYVDKETGAHLNKFGIRDKEALREIEYGFTEVRIAQLNANPIPGRFDLDHLKQVHRHIFQDLYEWAGKERTVNFSKRDPLVPDTWRSLFAPAKQIGAIAAEVSQDLQSSNFLKGLKKDEFVAGMAKLYVKVNYMHPFPEGNGRSTQTMLSQLAREAGYELNFGAVGKDAWNHAAARSMPQRNISDPKKWRQPDGSLIHNVFKQVVEISRERDRPQDLQR